MSTETEKLLHFFQDNVYASIRYVRRVSFSVGITYGYADAHHFALGLLHDVIEDTFVPQDILVNLFGHGMYADILSLSKEIPAFDSISGRMIKRAKISDDEYYPALASAGVIPRRIKGCDRIDNLADLVQWESARREKYIVETNTRILPIVNATDLRMSAEIQNRLKI